MTTLSLQPLSQQIYDLIQKGSKDDLMKAHDLVYEWTEEEPSNPRAFLHFGDLQKRLEQIELAIQSFRVAAKMYLSRGKTIQAIAAHKLILDWRFWALR